MTRSLLIFLSIVECIYGLWSQTQVPLGAYDVKIHAVGNVRRAVANSSYGLRSHQGLVCEFPLNSGMEHITPGYPQLEIAAIAPPNDSLDFLYTNFFPAPVEPWDTIWVVRDYDVVDIPYWKSYQGTSDEDFVFYMRNDSIQRTSFTSATTGERLDAYRSPLYLDVTVRSLAWSLPPLDEVLVYSFRVTPRRWDLRRVFVSLYFTGGIGKAIAAEARYDDQSTYFKDEHIAIVVDGPLGFEGQAKDCVGYRIFPPRNVLLDTLRWTSKDDFTRADVLRGVHSEREFTAAMYGLLSSGGTLHRGDVFGTGWISVGPFDLKVGDTLAFWTSELLGMSINEILQKSALLDKLYANDFRTPMPPPPPPVRVETESKKITLRWDALPGQVNPETFRDFGRVDKMEVPFEGYRVYKSTESINGPWTLVREYDIAQNGFANEFGLEREYTETMLLNNFEYYYAVTAFSKRDTVIGLPSRESRKELTARAAVPGSPPTGRVGQVAVVPNPYRGDIVYHQYNPPWERPTGKWTTWFENDRRVQFINLPLQCEIKIYTLAGDWIASLQHDDPTRAYHDWNLVSHVGQAVSSGIYLFSVQDKRTGEVQVGKFILIK